MTLRTLVRVFGNGEGHAGGVAGDDPESGRLVQSGPVPVDLVAGWQMGKGFFEDWLVLGPGKALDGLEHPQ